MLEQSPRVRWPMPAYSVTAHRHGFRNVADPESQKTLRQRQLCGLVGIGDLHAQHHNYRSVFECLSVDAFSLH